MPAQAALHARAAGRAGRAPPSTPPQPRTPHLALPRCPAPPTPAPTTPHATRRPTPSGTHLHPLDTGAGTSYGPRGVLLVGLPSRIADAAQDWLHAMEPGLPVAHCTGGMLDELTSALLTENGAVFVARPRDDDGPPPSALPRLVLLSGLLPAEAVAIAEHWAQFVVVDGGAVKIGVTPTFCVLTPAMLDRKLGDVVLEATLAAAAARDDDAGRKQRGELDADGIRAALREKMAARAATRASGPIQLDVGGGGSDQEAVRLPPPAAPERAKPKGFGRK